MERYFKRYFWVVPLGVAGICALFAFAGVKHVMAARAMTPASVLPPDMLQARKARKAKPAAPVASKDEVAVTDRNMFCSSCVPASAAPPPPPSPTAPVDPNAPPPTTALPLSLLVTTVVDSDEELSSASVTNTALARSGHYRMHDLIPGAGDVVSIRAKWIDFHNDQASRVERLYLVGITAPTPPPAPAPPPAPTPPPVADAPAPAPGTPEEIASAIDKGVQKISDTQYTLDRGLINRILNDPTQVMKGGRLGPYIKDGKPLGFKFYTVRANSAYAKIGLQTGDVLQSVNGFEITSPDKALEVYTKLKSASSLSLTILRNDQPMTIQYTVR